ncbi:MAG: hypothetical protein KQJ78_01855 [Deltaproteobacteria bacterium]|nr:hypothetical protein [Deltaproteobacteria bacterium]
MHKHEAAARFFAQLSEGSSEFITNLIEKEMDAELIELLNKFGGQLQMGGMEPSRFQASLLIIGYLLRAHEEKAFLEQGSFPAGDEDLLVH